MFTIGTILGTLKKLVSFLWEYKFIILTAAIIIVLYLRGNNYKQDFEVEATAHIKTVLEYNQQINNIRLANEQALRIAQEESAANYKALVEKTGLIQKEYIQNEKDINATITKLNSSNNSLQQTINEYTKRNSTSDQGSLRDTSDASSLQLTGELLAECVERKQYYGTEAQKLGNSVTTLQEWGNMVIESNKNISKGDKDE